MKLQGLKDWGYSKTASLNSKGSAHFVASSIATSNTASANQESATKKHNSLGASFSVSRLALMHANTRQAAARRSFNSQALVGAQYAQSPLSIFDALIGLSIFASITAVALLAFAKLG